MLIRAMSKQTMFSFLKTPQSRELGVLCLVIVCLIACSISVAYSVHSTRQNVAELSQLSKEQNELEIEWEKLLLELNLLSGYNRIESKAVNSLGMQVPSSEQMRVISLKGAYSNE